MQMGCVGALIRGYKNNAEDNIMTESWTMEHLNLEDRVQFWVSPLRKDGNSCKWRLGKRIQKLMLISVCEKKWAGKQEMVHLVSDKQSIENCQCIFPLENA